MAQRKPFIAGGRAGRRGAKAWEAVEKTQEDAWEGCRRRRVEEAQRRQNVSSAPPWEPLSPLRQSCSASVHAADGRARVSVKRLTPTQRPLCSGDRLGAPDSVLGRAIP
jgi:hypothetical protein